jgi:hypothetical protein
MSATLALRAHPGTDADPGETLVIYSSTSIFGRGIQTTIYEGS